MPQEMTPRKFASIDCSGNPNFPEATARDWYVVTVGGKIGGSSGTVVGVGATIQCLTDTIAGNLATVGSSWNVIQEPGAVGDDITFAKEIDHVISVAATTTASTPGGALSIAAGTSGTDEVGGLLFLRGGVGGVTGIGGAASLQSGPGGSTSGASGDVSVVSGAPTAGSGSDSGGVAVQSSAGATGTTTTDGGASGVVSVITGAGGAKTGTGTANGGASGALTVGTNAGGATAATSGGTGGAAGLLSLSGGAGGAASAGTSNGGAGGSIRLTAGAGGASAGGTAGLEGGVFLRATNAKIFRSQVVSTSETDGANAVAAADFVNGICVHTVSQARALTTPTGAQITAVCPTALAAGDSFDFTVITVGVGADDVSTLTAGDGNVTFVGPVTVGGVPAHGGTGSAATWRFRYSGTSAWVGYRIA